MKRNFVLVSTITCLVIGQSSVTFATTNEEQRTIVKEVKEESASNEQQVEDFGQSQVNVVTQTEPPQVPNEEMKPDQQTEEKKDEEAPTIHNVSVDKKAAGQGDIITISADVEDPSGVKYVTVVYRNTTIDSGHESKDTIEIQLTYNAVTKKYEGKFVVYDWITKGIWDVFSVVLGDNAENETSLSSDEVRNENTSFTVNGKEVDSAGPVFERIEASKNKVKLGEESLIKVKASDKSGVDSVIVSYIHQGTWVQQDVEFEKNDETGYFEGGFYVDELTRNGVWRVSSIELIDAVGNTTYVTRKAGQPDMFANAEITVSGASDDVQGPELIEFKLSKNNGNLGEKIKLLATTKDATGVEYIEATYVNQESHRQIPVIFKTIDGIHFEGEFTIEKGMDNGSWELDNVTLVDLLGNETYIDGSNYPFATITVSDGNEDFAPPIIHDVIVNKPSDPLKEGDVVTFSVDATDEKSVIKTVAMVYEKPVSNLPEIIELKYNEQSKRYEGKFEIKAYTEMGIWKNYGLLVEDGAGNIATEEPVLNSNFTVVGTILDKEAPKIQDVQVISEKEVVNGEKVRINAHVTDDFSGVSKVRAIVVNEKAMEEIVNEAGLGEDTEEYKQYMKVKNGLIGDITEVLIEEMANMFPTAVRYIKLDKNTTPDVFEGEVIVDKGMARGEWKLGGLYFMDNADNIGGSDPTAYKQSFTVVDKKTPPPISDVDKPSTGGNSDKPEVGDSSSTPPIVHVTPPNTGDSSNIPLYGAGFIASLFGLGFLAKRRKK